MAARAGQRRPLCLLFADTKFLYRRAGARNRQAELGTAVLFRRAHSANELHALGLCRG